MQNIDSSSSNWTINKIPSTLVHFFTVAQFSKKWAPVASYKVRSIECWRRSKKVLMYSIVSGTRYTPSPLTTIIACPNNSLRLCLKGFPVLRSVTLFWFYRLWNYEFITKCHLYYAQFRIYCNVYAGNDSNVQRVRRKYIWIVITIRVLYNFLHGWIMCLLLYHFLSKCFLWQ